MEDSIQWKSVWQMVSGLHQETPKTAVREKLMGLSEDLKEGLLQFKRSNTSSDDTLEKLLKTSDQEKLLSFTKQLQQFLDLDALQTWSTLCTYLLNDYKGSPNSLFIYIANETNKWRLFNDIWNYYSLERMIVLKLIKHLLEFHREPKHPYSEEYKDVLMKIGLSALKKKLMDQLEVLLKEDGPQSFTYIPVDQQETEKLALLSSRKLKEINELLQIIFLLCHYEGRPTTADELKQFLGLFKNSSITQVLHYQANDYSQLLQRIEGSKVVLLMYFIQTAEKDMKKWNKDTRQDIDNLIIQSHQYSESGPILLAWMVKNIKYLAAEDMASASMNGRIYHQCGNKAIQLDVFSYLLRLIQSKAYSNRPHTLLATLTRRMIYQVLCELCDLFDADGSVGHHRNIFDLFAELLTTPSIAIAFMLGHNDENQKGCSSLFNTAIELFPTILIPVCKIANALATSGTKHGGEFIKSRLENMPVYTETYTGQQYNLQPIQSDSPDDEFELIKDYYPMAKFGYKIPKGSRVVIIDRKETTFVHFRHPCNFFQVLHHDIATLLSMSVIDCSADDGNGLVQRITYGVQYLKSMLEKLKNPAEITGDIVHPVEMVFDLLMKLKTHPTPPLQLLANCLEVCAALLPFFDEEILKRVLNLNILPMVSNTTLSCEEYASGVSFDSCLVGQYLINYETTQGKYVFLKAYFNFLKIYKKINDTNIFRVELPGLIFLLREIFPSSTWRCENDGDMNEIYIFAMEYFFEVLQLTNTGDAGRRLLRDTCIYSLLNLENGMTLLKFVGIGNPYLQSKMESESNWVTAVNSGLNAIVHLAMTILMQILRQKADVSAAAHNEDERIAKKRKELSPLETVIYTQPKQRDQLRIIPVVTSYMNNMFNRRLPILSCRLLRRFAIEFQMSLLACLDMEQDHIRMIFLQRLRDDLGSTELKIAILEFVEACLDKQPGVVEAFFDIRYESERKKKKKSNRSKFHTEGITAYMDEYLDAIAKEPEKIASPLLSRIMSLFHAVWRNNMQSLIGDLVNDESFWSSLCKPLFEPLVNQSLRAYSQLFNILGLEMFKQLNTDLSPQLEAVLKRFFEVNTFSKWMKFLFEIPHHGDETGPSDETPEWLRRLQSFKDLLVITLKKDADLMPPKTKYILLKSLIDEILCRLGIGDEDMAQDLRPLVILAELYTIVLLNNGSQRYTETPAEDKQLFERMSKIMGFVATAYEDLIPRIKEGVLGATVQVLLIYNTDVTIYPANGSSIVQSTVSIICQELYAIQNSGNAFSGKSRGSALSLSLILLRKLLLINEEERFLDWQAVSTANKLVYCLMSSVQHICQNYEDRKITLELLDLLAVIATATDTNDFLFCDISEYLWLKLLPPKNLLSQGPFNVIPASASGTEQWSRHDWWPIYAQGIELVNVLLDKHECLFVQQALGFVGIHEEYLMDSLNLVRDSLEPKAMQLIKKAVTLICGCAKYRKTWQLEHQQSMINLMRCIQVLTENLISLLYRPNLLKMLLDGKQHNNKLMDLSAPVISSPELINAMNQIIEIIILCTKALLYFSPPLNDLICGPQFMASQWHSVIEIQFGAPKLNETFQPLSFGTLLSAVGTFTKSLNLLHFTFSEMPLNFKHENATLKDTSSVNSSQSMGLTTVISPRSTYSKTLSVSSIASQSVTLANCNELLSNLDGKLCLMALEYTLTLLLSQSYLAIKDAQLSVREKQLIKRELSTELMLFHDFVKKRLLLETVGSLSRKKYGTKSIATGEEDVENGAQQQKQPNKMSTPQQRRLSQPNNSMRVNVVRKLHLQQKVHAPEPALPGSTPHPGHKNVVSFDNMTPIRASSYDSYDRDIEYNEVEEVANVGLSIVNIVEEDYLHFLSNLFSVLCHSDN